jgi:hypothetical protein
MGHRIFDSHYNESSIASNADIADAVAVLALASNLLV